MMHVLSIHAVAQDAYYILRDLGSEWKVYSKSEDALVPYIESVNSNLTNIYISVDPEEYYDHGILIDFKKKSALFINNQLAYNAPGPERIILSIDSLAKIYATGKLLFSIYSEKGIQDIETSLVSYTKKNPILMDEIDHLSIHSRTDLPLWDFMKLGVIIISIFYVILINIGGRVFNNYYNILRSFARASADEFLNRTKKITRIDLIYIIVLALVLSFFIVVIQDHHMMSDIKRNLDSLGALFIKWFWFFILIVIWIMLRLFIISLSSDLFRVRAIGTVHIFEYLRITNFYSLLIFMVMVLFLFVFQVKLNLFSSIILYSVVVIGVLRGMILYLKFLNSSDFTKLYLFAYLCSAELLPVIIGLKILFKSNLLHTIV
jgi:hypothetical protein